MTILQLLESQNMASACRTENTFTHHADTVGGVGGTQHTYTLDVAETVCYQPIIGYTFILSIPFIFAITAYLVYCWFNPSHKNK